MSDDFENPQLVPNGTVVASRYRTEKRIGAGGMGEVYLVQHVHTDERFAMKVLLSTIIADESALERFRREARTPARIDSEHVVRVTDADVAPELKGAPFLVMEYLRGEDLDHFIEANGPMAPRDVVTFLQQVARALDKAHALGIVHRDLKPENIFITRREDGSPHLKILDFGIAKFTSGATSDFANKTATSPGQIYGTPLYMAPEQAKGESKRISPQTDLWAIGIIAVRMLTAKDFWDAETLTALIAQVVYEPLQKPSEKGYDFGPRFDEWFFRCCSRDPDARFATAGETVFKLGQALGVIDADASFQPGAPSSLLTAPPPSLRQASFSSPGPRPLSRTELQLAQTGVAGTTASGRGEKGPFVKVALGATLIGALIALGIFGLKPKLPDHAPAKPVMEGTANKPAASTDVPMATATTVVTLSSAPEPSAQASSAPSGSATPSSEPSAATSGKGRPLPVPPVKSAAPKASATGTAVTPPPPKDPLGGRL